MMGAALVLLAVAVGTTARGGSAADGWTALYPLHQPLSLSLPTTWTNSEPPAGTRFYAQSPTADANVELYVGAFPGRAATFTSTMFRRAREVYLAQDPNATIRSRTLTLPAGRAIEVITRLVRSSGSRSYPLSVQSYAFLHEGIVYEFVYLTLTPKVGTYVPIFEKSARSIRFR
jgi:hypothetical protein